MKHIVVLTGAGMSAESGIATFRDSGGLWNTHKIEDVATPEGFYKNPQLVLDFYRQRRDEINSSQPNSGHLLLSELEKDYRVTIITQNIDNLHERAGSSNVIHLHGEINKVCSSANTNLTHEIAINSPYIKLGDKAEDGSQLRPFIVWFGEAVPEIENAIGQVAQADLFLIVGTSLNVYPAAGLINYVKNNCPIFLIDPNEVKSNNKSLRVIREKATVGLEQFRNIIKEDSINQ